MNEIARTLIAAGLIMTAAGVAVLLVSRVTGGGRLPGDFVFRKGEAVFIFPLATCILISLVLTVLFNLFGRK